MFKAVTDSIFPFCFIGLKNNRIKDIFAADAHLPTHMKEEKASAVSLIVVLHILQRIKGCLKSDEPSVSDIFSQLAACISYRYEDIHIQ